MSTQIATGIFALNSSPVQCVTDCVACHGCHNCDAYPCDTTCDRVPD